MARLLTILLGIAVVLIISAPTLAAPYGGEENIALHKSVTSSHPNTIDGQPGNAVDGDLTTCWNAGVCATPSSPAWIIVDLAEEYSIRKVVLSSVMDRPNVSPGYFVDYVLYESGDAIQWNYIGAGRLIDTLEPVDQWDVRIPNTRYIRYEIVGGTHWAHIYEVEVYQAHLPRVSAGNDVEMKYPPNHIVLDGKFEDNGEPNSLYVPTWNMISGPGEVVFDPNESILNPTVTLSLPGTYILRLTAKDGALQSYDEMTITYSYDVMYVDSSATGANTGSSWEDAIVYLRDAVIIATPGTEIRVAQGTYRPDQFSVLDRLSMGRIETFELKSGVILKGGYKGIKGISNIKYQISKIEDGRTPSAPTDNGPDERDPAKYPTILSGDLEGNDNPVTPVIQLRSDPSRVDNAYHVVTAVKVDQTSVLDGFVITGGHASSFIDPQVQLQRGGGLYLEQASPAISNCIFTRNTAANGGALSNYSQGGPAFTHCQFAANAATNGGAVINATIGSYGDCVFDGNYGVYGGAIYAANQTLLARCLITRNSVMRDGGGVYLFSLAASLVNCTVADNLAGRNGGGVFSEPAAKCTIANSILWGNKARGADTKTSQIFGGTQAITHSTIQGWYGSDPLFADPGAGDYRLRSRAGRWNPAIADWVMDDVTSPAIDAGSPFDPVGSEPGPHGGRINQGFDGGTIYASKSPDRNIADLNHDGKVNLIDFAIVAENWLWED